MPRFDVDGAVQAQVNDLIGKMRAKRLAGELPPPPEAVAGDTDSVPDESGDQQALESMLEVE